MKNQPLFLDVSSHQGQINYTALSQANEKVHGIFSRCGWGEDGGYFDQQFQRNWSKSQQFGYYRASYWAYWDYYPMLHQLDLWYQANPTINVIPRMWDLEKEGAPPEFLSEQTWLASEKVLSRDGQRFIIYSRVDILERTLCKYWTPEQLNMHYYMLAQYDVGDGQEYNGIVIPDFIEPKNVLWKQTSDKIHMFNGSGPMDRDRWIWTGVDTMHEQIEEMWGSGPGIPEEPVDPNCCEELRLVDASLEDGIKRNYKHITELQSNDVNQQSELDILTPRVGGIKTDLDTVKGTADINHTAIGNTRLELGELTDRVENTETKLAQLEGAMGRMATEQANFTKALQDSTQAMKDYEEEVESRFNLVELKNEEQDTELGALRMRLSIYEFFKKLFGRG